MHRPVTHLRQREAHQHEKDLDRSRISYWLLFHSAQPAFTWEMLRKRLLRRSADPQLQRLRRYRVAEWAAGHSSASTWPYDVYRWRLET
jgi:hypothetical protein